MVTTYRSGFFFVRGHRGRFLAIREGEGLGIHLLKSASCRLRYKLVLPKVVKQNGDHELFMDTFVISQVCYYIDNIKDSVRCISWEGAMASSSLGTLTLYCQSCFTNYPSTAEAVNAVTWVKW